MAIDFAVLLEDTFCWVIFITVCLNTLMLTLSGIQILTNLHNLTEIIRYGPFMVGQVIHIFVENIIGQQLVDYSSKVDISIQMMNWCDISLRSQKLLNLMTIRSRVVTKITAGKIFVMSVQFFGSVIKTSMTYFTLLRSLNEE
ncbi:uncharacterized protein [Chelonus insularis]|uniref:uncharacterized protein n=1 Tax=Chelonus insularis TaxID=460826 RepID=UPI0015899C7E|nr:uncharacterized protein LOC118066429 [Chelonus insularis]